MFNHTIEAEKIAELLANGTTAVINVVAQWCPDCTEAQAENIEAFRENLVSKGIFFANFVAQEDKGEFITPLHQALVEGFGGHGYPRTVLISNGAVVSADHVEVTDEKDLENLAKLFDELVNQL